MVTSPRNQAVLAPHETQPGVAERERLSPSLTRPVASEPSADAIREYANHLYVQRGSVDGYDCDDWLEAEACLRSNIPMEASRTRMHAHIQITERASLGLIKHGRSHLNRVAVA
jgi:hypothetical protein